jgi:hypothetical protein
LDRNLLNTNIIIILGNVKAFLFYLKGGNQMNIYGIKDSANVTIKRKSDGSVFLYADYATTSTNEWKASNVYAKSKDVNAIRWDWDYGREGTLKLEFEVFDLKLISMLVGSEFEKGSNNICTREVLEVSSSHTLTLSETPVESSLQVFKLDQDGITNMAELTVGDPSSSEDHYSVSDKTITVSETAFKEGDKISVFYVKPSEESRQLVINADKFAENFEVIGDTYIRGTDGVDEFVQIDFLNCKPKSNFTISMSASQVTKLSIEFDILKDTKSSDMATYTIYK